MLTKPYQADRELTELLREAAEHGTAMQVTAGPTTYVLRVEHSREIDQEDDLFANYDPDRMLKALDNSFGVLQGIDVEAFLEELRAERAQHGRDDVE